MGYDVFISYSRVDQQIADEICKSFDETGITYWIDRGGITSGEAFHAAIVRAISDSKVTLFISSVNSNMSEYTIKEIVIAFKRKKHIIPFCIDEEPFADKLEFYLCDLDQLACYMGKEFAIQKLVGDLCKLLGKFAQNEKSPAPAIKTLQNSVANTPQCFLKIRPNLTCDVFVDGDFKIKAEKDQVTKIPLNKGSYWLEFVNCENIEDKYAQEYTLNNVEELLTVELNCVLQKKIENVELIRFFDSGKYGFRDAMGKHIISAQYESASNFTEGLARVERSKKFGFIDKTGRLVVPFQYDWADVFDDGLARVRVDITSIKSKFGFIDTEGKIVIPLNYQSATMFSEGLSAVSIDGVHGFIDREGIMVIKCRPTGLFKEGLAPVTNDYKIGFIDKTGKTVIPFQYDRTGGFKNGSTWVELKGKKFCIDKTGKRI